MFDSLFILACSLSRLQWRSFYPRFLSVLHAMAARRKLSVARCPGVAQEVEVCKKENLKKEIVYEWKHLTNYCGFNIDGTVQFNMRFIWTLNLGFSHSQGGWFSGILRSMAACSDRKDQNPYNYILTFCSFSNLQAPIGDTPKTETPKHPNK